MMLSWLPAMKDLLPGIGNRILESEGGQTQKSTRLGEEFSEGEAFWNHPFYIAMSWATLTIWQSEVIVSGMGILENSDQKRNGNGHCWCLLIHPMSSGEGPEDKAMSVVLFDLWPLNSCRLLKHNTAPSWSKIHLQSPDTFLSLILSNKISVLFWHEQALLDVKVIRVTSLIVSAP